MSAKSAMRHLCTGAGLLLCTVSADAMRYLLSRPGCAVCHLPAKSAVCALLLLRTLSADHTVRAMPTYCSVYDLFLWSG
ncbi:hypothetical protein [Shewanella sp. 10N.286.54.B9]|uniref:hypothetical protein n=1 Tax=Shewanella sp. 10N.286.54.B9 TaxID=3229719 RepID=UPI003550876B